jgi:hypothetical protein
MYMLQEQDKPASKWRFPSEKLPKPCFGRHNHRRIASKGDVGDWKRATAVGFEAVVGECSRNLVAGLVAKTSREKLVNITEHQRGLVSTITKTV